MERRSVKTLLVVLIILFSLVVINAIWWANLNNSMDLTSGVWATLAMDSADGVFYRPLHGESGFGGTRYMPLFFMLHGLLIYLGLPPVGAGLLLNTVVMLTLMVGVYKLLQYLGADRLLALAGALVVVSPGPFFTLITSLRGDALSLTFGIWGIAFLIKGDVGARQLAGAALLFALAFFSKFSAVAAPAAGFFFLWFRFGKKSAFALMGATLVICLAFLVVTQILSQGRFTGIMQACAGGGMSIYFAAKAPYRMLGNMDYPTLLMLFTGLAAWWHIKWSGFKEIFVLYFIWALFATVLIFISPGTVANHFLDLFVACLVVTIASFFIEKGLNMRTGLIFLTILVLFGIETSVERMGEQMVKPQSRSAVYHQVADAAGTGSGPILSENPMIPVVKGQPVYLADPYMFQLLARRKPELRAKMAENIEKRLFSAVILFDRSKGPGHGQFLDKGLVDLVKNNYREANRIGEYAVFIR